MPILLVAIVLGAIPGVVASQAVTGGLGSLDKALRERKRWYHF